MLRERYNPLPHTKLESGAATYRFDNLGPRRVRHDTPAIEAMTDLRRVQVVTIGADASLDDANATMIRNGIRLLLVVDAAGVVTGMVAASDILGERPIQVGRERGLRFDELRVVDIMRGAGEIDVLDLADVLRAEVGHIVATLKRWGRQHALVVDRDDAGRQMIRGIFSLTQIGRQLGIALQATEVARNFAEIEVILAH